MFLIVVTSCGSVFEPSESWEEFNPTQQYDLWHQEVESCVGAQRSFEDIVWRKVYAAMFLCGEVQSVGCYAHPRTIYVAAHLMNSESLIKGEIIHYIRRYGAHDALFERCGGKKTEKM